jgi:hypothetical protein
MVAFADCEFSATQLRADQPVCLIAPATGEKFKYLSVAGGSRQPARQEYPI